MLKIVFVLMEKKVKSLLEYVLDQANSFSRHHLKYIQSIDRNFCTLQEKVKAIGLMPEVPFHWLPEDCTEAMGKVLQLDDDKVQKLELLGSYYSWHLLLLNSSLVTLLQENLVEGSWENRWRIYREFMLIARYRFSHLIASYLNALTRFYARDLELPELIFCNVGALADQDDIDIALIHRDGQEEAINNLQIVTARVSAEMLRRASPLHFYLPEYTRSHKYSATVEEYQDLLESEIRNFVIISQIIGAVPMFGSSRLFDLFEKKIVSRYFQSETDNSHHEGYLRGVLGEAQSLLAYKARGGVLIPKNEGYRLIKLLLTAQKTVFGIEKTHNWAILEELENLDVEHLEEYKHFEKNLSFLEVFRFLYHLIVVQEEIIRPFDGDITAGLESVANIMGYRPTSKGDTSVELLLEEYRVHTHGTRQVAQRIIKDIKRHLRKISVFWTMSREILGGQDMNVAEEALNKMNLVKSFRGITFWDDLIDLLSDDYHTLKRFVHDLYILKISKRRNLIKRYALSLSYDFNLLLRLVLLLQQHKSEPEFLSVLKGFNHAIFLLLEKNPRILEAVAKAFEADPATLFQFSKELEPLALQRINRFLKEVNPPIRIKRILENLRLFYLLNQCTSRFFFRFLRRIIEGYPEVLEVLDDYDQLRHRGDLIAQQIELLGDYSGKKEWLQDFYCVHYLRLALMILNKGDSLTIQEEHRKFSDNYLKKLYEICRDETYSELWKEKMKQCPYFAFAFLASGGNGRGDAFDKDYDLIVLIDATQVESRPILEKIISRMNNELTRLGIPPHHRIASNFNRYTLTVEELENYFKNCHPDDYIDRSEVLGTRFIFGDEVLLEVFQKRIIKGIILSPEDKKKYISDMIGEIEGGWQDFCSESSGDINIKEDPGGLKDVNNSLLLFKTLYEFETCNQREIMEQIKNRETQLVPFLGQLGETVDFLKIFRDLYRIMVAGDDRIEFRYIEEISNLMGLNPGRPQVQIRTLLHGHLTRNKKAIKGLLSFIKNSFFN